jgi:hypothetical protein
MYDATLIFKLQYTSFSQELCGSGGDPCVGFDNSLSGPTSHVSLLRVLQKLKDRQGKFFTALGFNANLLLKEKISDVTNVIPMRTEEDWHAPHGGFERIVPPQRHETAPYEGDISKGIYL